ncbi:MAG: tail fiber domain-containing protein [Chloroflexi bacterium]|nr:tail fiber domain-containing protein [Chloroflexota bacterium]
MIAKRMLLPFLILVLLLAVLMQSAVSQTTTEEPEITAVTLNPTNIQWHPKVAYSGATLTVSGPGELLWQHTFAVDDALSLTVQQADGTKLPDGQYTYEIQFAPELSAAANIALNSATDTETREQIVADLRQSGELPANRLVQFGYFTIIDGTIVIETVEEVASTLQQAEGITAPNAPEDQFIADDLIVDGSMCVGFDCVNGESFGFDTLRLKENNIRLHFDDTSNTSSFPKNDWRILINDTSNGGANKFSIEDSTAGRIPFTIEAGSPANALYVDNAGRLGINTATPVVDVHTVNGNTPTMRLEQDGSDGFTAQTWDVAGNEANFFIRDVTNGSRLSFRIRPGAPESSIDIAADGDVGMGDDSPDARLNIVGNDADNSFLMIENTSPNPDVTLLNLDANGNLTLSGLLTEASDESLKENVLLVEGESVLDRLSQVPIATWNYILDEDEIRHMGPMAQDFYAAFGLGADNRHVAPLDANGVALAGVQELHEIVQDQEAQIEALEQENEELEERLDELEALVNALLEAEEE